MIHDDNQLMNWHFKTHKVLQHCTYRRNEHLIELGNDYKPVVDEIEVLVWSKERSNDCRIIYNLDRRRGTLHVSGDLGSGTFNWYSSLRLIWISKLDISYFHSKMESSEWGSRGMEWDEDKAKKTLLEMLTPEDTREDAPDEWEIWDKRIKELHEAQYYHYLGSAHEWAQFVNAQDYDALFGINAYEWVYGIGDHIPYRVRSWLLGLKLAFKNIELPKDTPAAA